MSLVEQHPQGVGEELGGGGRSQVSEDWGCRHPWCHTASKDRQGHKDDVCCARGVAVSLLPPVPSHSLHTACDNAFFPAQRICCCSTTEKTPSATPGGICCRSFSAPQPRPLPINSAPASGTTAWWTELREQQGLEPLWHFLAVGCAGARLSHGHS